MNRRLTLITFILIAALGSVCGAATTIESKYPRLSSGALSQAVPTALPGALLEADGVKITSKDLTDRLAKMKSPAKEQFARYEFVLLEDIAVGRLVIKEAKDWAAKKGIKGTEEQLMRQYVDTTILAGVNVSEEEAVVFYESNFTMFGRATYQQVESAIKSYLQDEKANTAINSYVATFSNRHSIRISDAWAKQQHERWIKNPVEQARRSGKPTLAKFGADTCIPCLVMAPIIKALAKKYEGKLTVLDVDTDKEPVLGIHYGAQSIPLLIFYDKDGKEVLRHVGGWDKAAIEAGIGKIVK